MSSQDDGKPGLDFGPTLRGFVANQRLFDRYVLREILGRGGMGVVWLAQDEELEIPVALKFLPEEINRDAEAVASLKRETRRGLALGHPHIVKTYGFLRDERAAAIAMEFIDGKTLSALKAEREECPWFEVEEIKPWVRQMCEALDYAHNRARVLHRDLKPINVMLNRRGEIKITDFGVAHVLQDSASRVSTGAGSSGGTLVYMSPQQAVGERPTVADDIYSLGATLYDLLSGKPPFGGNPTTIHVQVRERVPPSIHERRGDFGVKGGAPVQREWQETIAACLEKDPAKRPESALEVAWRLGLVKDYEQKAPPPIAERDVVVAPIRAARQRVVRPWFAVPIGIVALSAAAGIGYYLISHQPGSKSAETTITGDQRLSPAGSKPIRLVESTPAFSVTAKQEATASPVMTYPLVITQSSTQTITPLNSVSCNNGTSPELSRAIPPEAQNRSTAATARLDHTDNSYWRAFDMAAITSNGMPYFITSVSFGIETASSTAGTQPVTVRLYTTSNFPAGFPGSLTQVATTTINVADQSGTVLQTPLFAVVPVATNQLVMELFTPNGGATGNLLFMGSNEDPETAPSYLSAAGCGITTPTTTAAIGFPNMHLVFNVNGTCGGGGGGTPTPTAYRDEYPPTLLVSWQQCTRISR